jgi:hypothetical protein
MPGQSSVKKKTGAGTSNPLKKTWWSRRPSHFSLQSSPLMILRRNMPDHPIEILGQKLSCPSSWQGAYSILFICKVHSQIAFGQARSGLAIAAQAFFFPMPAVPEAYFPNLRKEPLLFAT